MESAITDEKLICVHCGDECPNDSIHTGENYFCCTGCLFVYELLNESGLSGYYKQGGQKGLKAGYVEEDEYSFLDNPRVIEKFLKYSINNTAKVIFYIPQIYCSACIWLLENLYKLDLGVKESRVNFLEKEVSVIYNENFTTLRKIVELLASLGYKPVFNLANIEKKKAKEDNKSLYIKLGIAGFGFGNIMLFALPEYISGGGIEPGIREFLKYVNLALSPLVLYSSSIYLKSAYDSLKLKHINIDVPISLGIIVLFIRSAIDIIFGYGPGYIDSLAGLIFFLLLGKVFQKKTYHKISFDRDYKSYFPLSVLRLKDGSNQQDVAHHSGFEKENISLPEIEVGNKLFIRNNEIIPTDSKLLYDEAYIDYSFVTGESAPVRVTSSSKIYAGGKHVGSKIIVEALETFDQSYISELWNSKLYRKSEKSILSNISDTAARYFTIAVLIIAAATLFYWLLIDSTRALNSFTAVLLIACPCAIALTIPFTYGTVLRIFGVKDFYLKNHLVVEKIASSNSIIFDKTGTLTKPEESKITYYGKTLDNEENKILLAAVQNSTHPVSRMILDYLINDKSKIPSFTKLESFREVAGRGFEAVLDDNNILIGNLIWMNENGIIPDKDRYCLIRKNFVKHHSELNEESQKDAEFGFFNTLHSVYNGAIETDTFFNVANNITESCVFISINKILLGYFIVGHSYRSGLKEMFADLKKYDYKLYILTGDNANEKKLLNEIISDDTEIRFNQLPEDKLNFVSKLHNDNQNAIYLGDGLNDAGALSEANVGIAITESTSNFSPRADAILLGERLAQLPALLKFTKSAVRTVIYCYIISGLYHITGFTLAVQGILTPLIAAVLMPLSSISVVLFTVGRTTLLSKRIKLF